MTGENTRGIYKMTIHGWAWDHAKAVAERCAKRFKTNSDIEKYLTYCGWEPQEIEQILQYINRKKEG
jgi:hypothetical protein